MEKYITAVSIWYFGWFIFVVLINVINSIAKATEKTKTTLPFVRIAGVDLVGKSIYTFMPSSIYLIVKYIV